MQSIIRVMIFATGASFLLIGMPFLPDQAPSHANVLLDEGLERRPNPPLYPDLKRALDALSDNDIKAASMIRAKMPAGLQRQILSYAIAGSQLVSAKEIGEIRKELAGWPGLDGLRKLEERAVFRDNPPPGIVFSLLGETQPETPEGTIALVKAFRDTGQRQKASALIATLWRGDTMYRAIEDRIMADFSDMLSADDHKARMTLLLYAEKPKQARRFAALAGTMPLFEAFSAIINGNSDAGARLKAAGVKSSKDPAFLYLRIRHLRQSDKYTQAALLLKEAPRDRSLLVNSGKWWTEQRIVSRGLIEIGELKAAYQLVGRPLAESSTDIVEAEFHAGWYALRFLKDRNLATRHFSRILAVSDQPLALSRGFYWLARSQSDNHAADAFFRKAAYYSGTFYGQLATARLKTHHLKIDEPVTSAEQQHHFFARNSVKAIRILEAIGHQGRAQRLIRVMAEELTSPAEIVMTHRLASANGGPPFALEIGKIAYRRGFDVPTLAWPMGAIPDTADTSGSGKALAYAVARQESAFNPGAISPANAKGLLQLLPNTAKHVAGRHKIAWRQDLLTRDPGYNATLGAHYLGQQISDFDGSYILTLVAYNAGPRRVREWVVRYGDPRGKSLGAAIDWIEQIPFSETRSYVQRVMENYQVYKARLGEASNIERDLTIGRVR